MFVRWEISRGRGGAAVTGAAYSIAPATVKAVIRADDTPNNVDTALVRIDGAPVENDLALYTRDEHFARLGQLDLVP